MLLAEEYARSHGARSLGLSVFGFNDAARRLYESLGYGTTTVKMAKPLGTDRLTELHVLSAEVVARATASALSDGRGRSVLRGDVRARAAPEEQRPAEPRHICLPSSGSSSARTRSLRRRRDSAPRHTVRASSVTSPRSAPGRA